MNNKILFTALLLTVTFFILPVKAQVTIGSTLKPNPNSLLDLKENSDNFSTKGLVLPRVKLQSTDNPAPLLQHVKGMFVYNTEDYGSGVTAVIEGVYYNDGSKWIAVTSLAPVTPNNTTNAVTATHGGNFTVIDGVTTDAQGRITAVNTVTVTLPAESNDWHTTGNAGTAPTTNFLGTTDEQPLVIKVNNTRAGYISNSTTTNYNAIGLGALANNTGTGNNAFGLNALTANTSGNNNSAFGYSALQTNTASNNSAFGTSTLRSNTTGGGNSAFGYNALYSNTTGNYNSAVGFDALYYNKASNNSALGYQALISNIEGTLNSAVGYRALYSNTASYNSAVGSNALYNNTTGEQNSAFGYATLYSNTTGNGNSAVGANALHNTTTGSDNSAFGYYALYSNITGTYNSAFGFGALRYTTKDHNSAFGYAALYANIEGSDNSAFGIDAMRFNTTGDYNSAFGAMALYNNTSGTHNAALGYKAGSSLTTGSNNVVIGYNVQALANNSNNTITIGANGDNASTTANTRVFAPAWTYSSDRKWKHDIKSATQGLNFVMKLKPSEFIFNGDESNTKVLGFIAQDVQETMREEGMATGYGMVSQMTEDRLGLATTELIPVLTKAIQEQQAVIEALLKRVEALEQRVKN